MRVLFVLLLLPAVALAQAPVAPQPPIAGTWKLNPEKSGVQVPADHVEIAAGTPTPRTYAETKIDDYTTAWIDKVNGAITAQGQKIVSKDGRTLTITVDGQTAVRVYDRQP